VVIVVGVQYMAKAAEDRSAFVRWRNQLHDLGQGEDIYQLYVYPNAPMMALILYPLSLLPKVSLASLDIDLGALAWFALKVGMAILAFAWTVRLVQERDRPLPPGAQLVTALLSLRPIIGDLSHGNVNLLILFLVVAALYAFKHGRDGLAGVVLALAITCKVTPALFLPYFVWKRAWKTVAGCTAGLVLFLVLIPGTLLGPAHNWQLLNSWVEKMILPYALHGEVTTEHHNQSLPGLVYRLGTASPSFYDDNEQPADYHNLVSWHPDTARWVVKGCTLAFLVLLCWSCRTPTRPRDDWRLAAEFAVVVLGMLLFSERTWKHHCVTLLLPYAVLCYAVAALRLAPGWRWSLSGVVAASVLVMATTSTSLWEVFGYRHGAKLAQAYGAYVWAELLLLTALVALLRKHRTPAGKRRPQLET
jgi:hypothetical protein